MTNDRERWGTRLGFVLAAAGSAVGLGNLWRFPYLTWENGGATFVMVYLLSVAVVGLPILVAELVIGRRSQRNPVGAFRLLKPATPWFLVGVLGVIAGFVILSYYSVVAGWTLHYALRAATGAFVHHTPQEMADRFAEFVSDPGEQILWHAAFMLLTMGIVVGGIRGGIERATGLLMPLLFLILLVLAGLSLASPGALEGLRFLFRPSLGDLSGELVLAALGQSFFSLSLGMGAMIVYGSYLSQETNLTTSAIQVSILDTLVALLAVLMIFPVIFTHAITPTESAGILFTTLPVILTDLPGGQIVTVLFFLLLAFAALTSTISLLEVTVSWAIDQRGWSRRKSTLLLGTTIWVLGIFSALSFGGGWLAEVTVLGMRGVFDIMNGISSNVFLPVGGFFIALFAGWALTRGAAEEELSPATGWSTWVSVWKVLVRFVAPIVVALVFLAAIGLL